MADSAGYDQLPEWLSVLDLAAWWRVSRKTIFNYVTQGKVPPPVAFSPRKTRWRKSAPDVRRVLLEGPAAPGTFGPPPPPAAPAKRRRGRPPKSVVKPAPKRGRPKK